MDEFDGLKEECGLFGIWGHPEASELTYIAMHSLQHRGQQGAGIVSSSGDYLFGARGMGLLTEALSKEQLDSLKPFPHAIGHTRYASSGGSELSNVQPFLFKSHKGDLALAHNGNLVNALNLRRALEDEGAIFQTTSDSEVLAHLLRRERGGGEESLEGRKKRIKKVLKQVKGAFAFMIMHQDSLTVALDDHGVRPLMLGRKDGSYCVASETCAFTAIGAEYIRDIEAGEMITITDEGIDFDHYTDVTSPHMCSMEYIYFARADSEFRRTSTYRIRKELGRALADEMRQVDADIVIGVPDSSLAAAHGFSEASGIRQEQGLLKNRYVGRTFITPGQEARERAVRMKLSPVRDIVEGRRVIVIDDSIVRGTTSRFIVKALKKAGAKEVHMGVSSPPLKNPCYYGIDVSTHAEIIASRKSPEEIRDEIGADSLTYLSVDKMHDVYHSFGSKGQCDACFTGNYPIDIEEAILPQEKDLKQKGV
ncbi:amidophosphoribosyltransferase [Salinicoccus halitifaciens]|uniref:Amidophosphoribosyltransferase n=1 Tax=Salinicoccus halitifaciens TaxID=1073415 RepID=A0ABV2E8F6_9STAP|nr:amidophosphoribosyltransferase [Salinicoccus halitifaciens]MCD2136504.1 amidophosphoribosyltransferase [Salinicoccus halitifaciens]